MLESWSNMMEEDNSIANRSSHSDETQLSDSRTSGARENLPANTRRIMIVDDLDIIRRGLQLVFEKTADLRIVAEASDGLSAVKTALSVKPDLVLLDINISGLDGVETVSRIKEHLPKTRIIMFTSQEDDDLVMASFGAGADGFCLKNISFEELQSAIYSVLAGNSWIDPRVVNRLIEKEKPINSAGTEAGKSNLSEADLYMLKMIEQGNTHEQTAKRMNISVSELREKLRHLIEKLFASDPTAKRPSPRVQLEERLGARRDTDAESRMDTNHEHHPGEGILTALPPGSIFDRRYRIEYVLGRGGMGIVYRAKHIHMQRSVAIKVLYPQHGTNLKLIRRLQQESRAASALQHANIVSVHDFGLTEQGHPFLIMDYVDGDSLDRWIRVKGGMSIHQYMDVFMQVANALSATHMQGIVHCDLKPSNIMLDGNIHQGFTPQLVDFGLAVIMPTSKNVYDQQTQSFDVLGSPLYMSPEQCEGTPLDFRTDIYSLGCIMYEALTDRPVFECTTPYQLFHKHVNAAPEPFSVVAPHAEIPKELETIVMRCLQKKPDNRFASASAIANDLRKLLAV
jgi:DNA-binding NarL/FixJ family response regulator/tRNA A-37 threonylcarbamoyl transferase component Bud32